MRTITRRALLRMLATILHLLFPVRRTGNLKRILVIKPDHAGDLVLVTPALRALRRRQPSASITLLAGPWAAPLLGSSPEVDRIVVCPFPGFTRRPKSHALQPYWLLFVWAARLRLGHYDVALIARDDHWWGALLALCAGIPQRVGFAVPEVKPFLTTALAYDPREHVTVQSLALVAALPGVGDHEQPVTGLTLDEAAKEWAVERLSSLPASRGIVGIQPGAGGRAKLWLDERWALVAQAVEAQGYLVMLTGGPDEHRLVEEIAERLQRPVIVVDAPSLLHLGALFAHCTLVLGVDSGPLHVAAAVGAPTLALFGPGNVRRFGPWGDPELHSMIASELWCAPCGVLDYCPRGTEPSECMATISVVAVQQRVDALLQRRADDAVRS